MFGDNPAALGRLLLIGVLLPDRDCDAFVFVSIERALRRQSQICRQVIVSCGAMMSMDVFVERVKRGKLVAMR
jgi:hypothetical protein